jgi:sugar O-acyltransferase (sialic acid O-acetyltransferase NeuD family)
MKSIIIGAGTYGETYLDYLREAGVNIVGFLDDNTDLVGKVIRGTEVLGTTSLLPELKERYGVEDVYCPIGSCRIRVGMLERARALGYRTPNFIHNKADIAPTIFIDNEGIYIESSTIIFPYVTIERDVMICGGTIVAHHCHLAQGTFISAGVNFGASIRTGKYAYIGIGSTIMTGIKELGEDCLVGAGAVVIRDVPERAVVAGVPAKVLRIKESI